MSINAGRRAQLWWGGSIVTVTTILSLGFSPTATAESPTRYPYDPACAWGRLADGHGMLIRCLEPGEATVLLEGGVTSRGTDRAARGGSAESAGDSQTQPDGEAQRNPAAPRVVVVSNVGPVQADTGELPLAAKKLAIPKDRYVDCVNKHGGLSADEAKLVVRFLVRERGRAEGVSVKSREGISQKAAACIADVVDRRYVGYPAAPIVGATIPIELSVQR